MQWLILILTVPYIYLLLKLYRSLRKINPYYAQVDHSCFISVVIACRNEESALPLLLDSIASQDYDGHDFEVIIVNDNSADSTEKVAAGFQGILNKKTIRNEGSGKKAAIRTGILSASGEIIVTTDADCIAGKNWLKSISSFFTEHKTDLLICPVMLEGRSGFLGNFQVIEFLAIQGLTAGAAALGKPIMCNGANLAFSKRTYLENMDKLHDEYLSGDDIFLLHSVKQQGKKTGWLESDDAIVKSRTATSPMALIRQRTRWISKAGAYSDIYTKIVAIVTFVTILTQLVLMIGGLIYPELLMVFAAFFLLKSVPDYLLIANRARFFQKKGLIRYFLPAQFLYPFYVMIISVASLLTGRKYRNP